MVNEVQPKADYLIEVLNEVANPIGGVYTVVATKSAEMKKYYGDNFWAFGPYYPQSAASEFAELTPPPAMKKIFDELAEDQIYFHYGIWLIPGKPKAILADFSQRRSRLPEIKQKLKNEYGVDSYDCGDNVDEQILWSDCFVNGWDKLATLPDFKDKKGVISFHLSDAGSFLLYLAKNYPDIGLTYTVHSTSLGRNIVLNNGDLAQEMKLKPTVEEGREKQYGGMVKTIHQFERECAKAVDVLTTVSEITTEETRYLFGKETDIVTPNGVDRSYSLSLEEKIVDHINAKARIISFLNAYFSAYYPVDVNNSLLFYSSGRYQLLGKHQLSSSIANYEMNTKGYDRVIKSLGQLNNRLKKEGYERNIFVFLFLMAPYQEPKEEILNNLAIYKAIEQEIDQELPKMRYQITNAMIHGKDLSHSDLFGKDFLMSSEKLTHQLMQVRKTTENPPICVFKGLDKSQDPVLALIEEVGLHNREEDKVKVIFYPAQLSVKDRLLKMSYADATTGMHLGIFPSLYEPWGYTPLECSANAVITITTDQTGYAGFVKQKTENIDKQGIFILSTENYNRMTDELVDILYQISYMSKTERVERKLEARSIALKANWKEFSKDYIKAHNLAIQRAEKSS